MAKIDRSRNPVNDAPPVFKSWNQLYGLVLLHLVFLIVVFYLFTRVFE